MVERSLRHRAAIAGIGETTYYKRGLSPDPEPVLVLRAVLAACEDAGLDPHEIDGFASYSNDRNTPARLATALNLPELKFGNMFWGGGGGGAAGAVTNAAMAVATGVADCVVAYRGLAQGQFGRFGQGGRRPTIAGEYGFTVPYGVMSPAQTYAMRTTKLLEVNPRIREAMRAIAVTCYRHAQNNPRAVMQGRELDEGGYDESRWIVEPFHLYDCCLENDGAAAVIVVSPERARDLAQPPVHLLGAAQGAPRRAGATAHNQPEYVTSSFLDSAKRLYDMARLTPDDVDCVQSYENFTGAVVMSLVEHGFCTYQNAHEVLTAETLSADGGSLPLNTSGGNLAECYMHGLGLHVEAIRQLRGQSTNQVDDCDVVLVNAGPMVENASACIYGSPEVD
ncbi:MAG: acetyl-CoA acetyltransferase [Actinomycetia bacterium]|nr:acetyl-CoA acetyltransferase [Actinomycetes bacterium]